jgi:hypothetical protein
MSTPPWKKSAPPTSPRITLTPANREWARARALKAGRRYPNLVDNLAAVRRQQEQEHAAREKENPFPGHLDRPR